MANLHMVSLPQTAGPLVCVGCIDHARNDQYTQHESSGSAPGSLQQRDIHGASVVANGRRQMAGRCFDEWQVGDVITHEIRRTVTETDNLLFSTMTHNPQPLHIDREAAKQSEFGQILVNGTFTFALMIGLSVGDTTLSTLVANLGYDKLVMPKPV